MTAPYCGCQRVGLVLTGGSLQGVSAQVGAWKALAEAEFVPDAIVGCSAGSVVGSLWASGVDVDMATHKLMNLKLDDYWDPIGRSRIRDELFSKFTGETGYVRGNYLRDWLEKNLGAGSIESCKIPFRPVVCNISRRRQEVPSSGPLAQYVRASTAIPLVFRAEMIGNDYYVDGGVTEIVPVDTCVDSFPWLDRVLVVTTIENLKADQSADNSFMYENWTPLRVALRSFQTMRRNQRLENLESSVPVDVITLDVPDIDIDDPSMAGEVWQEGYEVTKRWILDRIIDRGGERWISRHT